MTRASVHGSVSERPARWPAPLEHVLRRRRRIRFEFMLSRVQTWDSMRVLDLGCGRTGRSTSDFAPADWRIVGLDRLRSESVGHEHPAFTYVRGDAADLSRFGDRSFDLVLSVGLLEHITDEAAFARCAGEIQRVGRQYALLVPFRYPWAEPHYIVPLFPVLPRWLQRQLIVTFNLHGHRRRALEDPDFLERKIRWRTNEEYRLAFPGASVAIAPSLESIVITRALPAPGAVSA